ncbi:MAG: superfamily protein [Candidatus Saccharibacteria bacterium]|nr:superfamily protein [Candidatus Saccharibacteria bacterium]
MKQELLAFDTAVAKQIGRLPKNMYLFFSVVGLIIRPALWITAAVVLAAMLYFGNEHRLAIICIISALFVPLSSVLKLLMRRSRPVTIYTKAMRIKSYSFPSSHSYSAALIATLLVFLATVKLTALAPLLFIILALIVLLVGVSRIFVGAHYPSDVLGGIILGIIIEVALIVSPHI